LINHHNLNIVILISIDITMLQRANRKNSKQPNDNLCDEYIYAMQLHKTIRDIFHIHVHHSTDLLLPPVDARDLDDAAIKIAELFFSKFVNYKRFAGPPVATRQGIENLYRGRGEIEYARVFWSYTD